MQILIVSDSKTVFTHLGVLTGSGIKCTWAGSDLWSHFMWPTRQWWTIISWGHGWQGSRMPKNPGSLDPNRHGDQHQEGKQGLLQVWLSSDHFVCCYCCGPTSLAPGSTAPGWGQNCHRYYMELELPPHNTACGSSSSSCMGRKAGGSAAAATTCPVPELELGPPLLCARGWIHPARSPEVQNWPGTQSDFATSALGEQCLKTLLTFHMKGWM